MPAEVLEPVDEVIIDYAPDGTITWASPSLTDVLGYEPAEVIGTCLRLNVEEDLEEADRAVAEALASGASSVRSRLRSRCADGSTKWTDTRVHFVRDADGRLLKIVASIRDVTREAEWQRVVQEAEERFRLTMEHAPIGMALVAPDGALLEGNPALFAMLGRDEASLKGLTWQELTHPDDLSADADLVNQVLAGKRDGYRRRTRYLRPDGSIVWGDMSVAVVRDAAGAVRYFISQILDVTERVEIEQRYRILAENASVVVSLGRNDGTTQWVSESVTGLLGWLPQDVVDRQFAEFVHPDDRPAWAVLQRGLLSGAEGDVDVRIRTSTGGFRWVGIAARPVFDDHGVVDGRVAAWRDTQGEHDAREALAMSERRFRLMAENASDIVFHSVEGITEWVSPSLTAVTGWLPGDLIGATTVHLWHPDDRGTAVALRDATYAGEVGRGELRFQGKDGSYVWLEVALQPYLEPDGRTGAVGIMRDISDRVRERQARALSEERYRLLAENASDVVFLTSADGIVQWVSPSVTAMLGWSPDELVGHPSIELLHPDEVPAAVTAQERLNRGDVVKLEARLRTATGEYRWMGYTARPLLDESGAVVGRVSGWRDIEAEHEAQAGLQAAEERYRLLAQNSSDVVVHSRDGVIAWISPSVTAALGGSPADWIGRRFADIVHPGDVPPDGQGPADVSIRAPGVVRARMKAHDGAYHWIEATYGPYLDARGNPDGVISSLRVVDAMVAVERELDYRARFDALTGLLNRREVLQRLAAISSSSRQPVETAAVLFCDIDRFKDINDTYGHVAGDTLLRIVAERVSATVRHEDFAARFGGDELLVILTGVHSLDEAAAVAEKIRDAVSVAIDLECGSVTVTLSIGVTLVRPGESTEALVVRADEAMYDAKSRGRNQVITLS